MVGETAKESTPTSSAELGISCGASRRHRGSVMVRMMKNAVKSYENQRLDNPPMEETVTEGEKHFKRLLDKQLNTEMTLIQLEKEKRSFTKSSTYQSITEGICGEVNLGEFRKIEEHRSKIDFLKQCGLNGQEIELWFATYRDEIVKCAVEPTALRSQLNAIDEKIRAKHDELDKPVQFRDVHYLTRHEMEIESTLKCTSERAKFLQKMITTERRSQAVTLQSDPVNCLKEIEEEMFGHLNKRKRKRKKIKNSPDIIVDVNQTEEYSPVATCSRRPISDEEILTNRLSVNELRQLPRFTDYLIGEPSNVLYLKNLPRHIIEDELSDLFGRFGEISIRILGGRMHGQAFITFSDECSASKALEMVNGYQLNKKPLVIQYKRKQN